MYLLDTTALLAHCLGEAGADEVNGILLRDEGYVAAVTWLEIRLRLRGVRGAAELLEVYRDTVAGTVDITREVAEAAFEIRSGVKERLPAVDALIAGAARVRGYRLIHRDPHFASIPSRGLVQKMLPVKG